MEELRATEELMVTLVDSEATTDEELTVPVVDSKKIVFDSEVTTDEEELTIDLEVTTEVRATEEMTVPVVESDMTTEQEEELRTIVVDLEATT